MKTINIINEFPGSLLVTSVEPTGISRLLTLHLNAGDRYEGEWKFQNPNPVRKHFYKSSSEKGRKTISVSYPNDACIIVTYTMYTV